MIDFTKLLLCPATADRLITGMGKGTNASHRYGLRAYNGTYIARVIDILPTIQRFSLSSVSATMFVNGVPFLATYLELSAFAGHNFAV